MENSMRTVSTKNYKEIEKTKELLDQHIDDFNDYRAGLKKAVNKFARSYKDSKGMDLTEHKRLIKATNKKLEELVYSQCEAMDKYKKSKPLSWQKKDHYTFFRHWAIQWKEFFNDIKYQLDWVDFKPRFKLYRVDKFEDKTPPRKID